MNVIKTVMGHSSVKTTEIYTGVDLDAMRAQMEKVTLGGVVPAESEKVNGTDVKSDEVFAGAGSADYIEEINQPGESSGS
jgi:hypothetical protein